MCACLLRELVQLIAPDDSGKYLLREHLTEHVNKRFRADSDSPAKRSDQSDCAAEFPLPYFSQLKMSNCKLNGKQNKGFKMSYAKAPIKTADLLRAASWI